MLSFLLEDIPSGGVEMDQELDASWFEPLLSPQFLGVGLPLHLHIALSRKATNVLVSGNISGSLAFRCSRCLKEVAYTVNHGFAHVLMHRATAQGLSKDLELTEDTEFDIFDGHHIEVEPIVAEEFVLSLPWFPLCKEDCRGLCQICGQDLNLGQCNCKVEPQGVVIHISKGKKAR